MRQNRKPEIEPLEGKSLMSTGLAETLTVSRATARPGDPIVLTYTRTNISHHDLTVSEGPSLEGFFVLHGGQEVWRTNSGPSPLYVIEKTLHPGQSISTRATWNGQTDGNHGSGATGKFVVEAEQHPGGPRASVTIEPAHAPPPHPHQPPRPPRHGH